MSANSYLPRSSSAQDLIGLANVWAHGQNVDVQLTRIVSGIAVLVIACGPSSASSVSSPATVTQSTLPVALVVFTTWIPDPGVINGPEPGYRPGLSGLTGHDVQSATAAIDMTGTAWVVNISFTPAGANLFAKLTRDNVAACPGDSTATCAQRHLGIWLDLTQRDIDSWGDPTFTSKVSQPFDLACLMSASETTVCPKFVTDPVTLQEIVSGNATISCGCVQQTANELAAAINSKGQA